MIPTLAPAWAAASAARCPASPAPMMSTSWEGTTGNINEGALPAPRPLRREAALLALSPSGGQRAKGGLKRPPDLLNRHHAAQHAFPIDRHQCTETTH